MTRVMIWFAGSIPMIDVGVILEVENISLFRSELRHGDWMILRTPAGPRVWFDGSQVIAYTEDPKFAGVG